MMKTIGLIGGMSWESSLVYYRLLNEEVRKQLGGLHSAKCVLYSVDFAEIDTMQREARWEEAGEVMAAAAKSLEAAGADMIILCTNTMHKLAYAIEEATSLPFLHIADATATAILANGHKRVALLATRFTMEQDFYIGRLRDVHGLEVLVPEKEERELVHEIIYSELCVGIISEESKQRYIAIIDRLIEQGAEAIILGCTEIGLLISAEDCTVPIFDTAAIHARVAVNTALEKEDRS